MNVLNKQFEKDLLNPSVSADDFLHIVFFWGSADGQPRPYRLALFGEHPKRGAWYNELAVLVSELLAGCVDFIGYDSCKGDV